LNARLDTIQAAVLLEKLIIFDAELEKRRSVASNYDELLLQLLSEQITPPFIEEHNTSAYAQYTIRCPAREKVQGLLAAQGIPTAVHYPVPIHLQPAYANSKIPVGTFPHAEKAAAEVMSLPMHPYLERAEQEIVVKSLSLAVG